MMIPCVTFVLIVEGLMVKRGDRAVSGSSLDIYTVQSTWKVLLRKNLKWGKLITSSGTCVSITDLARCTFGLRAATSKIYY